MLVRRFFFLIKSFWVSGFLKASLRGSSWLLCALTDTLVVGELMEEL